METHIQIADTRLEGDDRCHRHIECQKERTETGRVERMGRKERRYVSRARVVLEGAAEMVSTARPTQASHPGNKAERPRQQSIPPSVKSIGLLCPQTSPIPVWSQSTPVTTLIPQPPAVDNPLPPLLSFQATFVPSSQNAGLHCWTDEAVWKGPEDRPEAGAEGPEVVSR